MPWYWIYIGLVMTLLKAQQKEYQLNISLKRQGQYPTMPASRALTVLIHNWPNTAKVISINHNPIDIIDDKQTCAETSQAGFWDEETKVL
jgi:oligosaccharide 4-alpha-D-glucosyltransferase